MRYGLYSVAGWAIGAAGIAALSAGVLARWRGSAPAAPPPPAHAPPREKPAPPLLQPGAPRVSLDVPVVQSAHPSRLCDPLGLQWPVKHMDTIDGELARAIARSGASPPAPFRFESISPAPSSLAAMTLGAAMVGARRRRPFAGAPGRSR